MRQVGFVYEGSEEVTVLSVFVTVTVFQTDVDVMYLLYMLY